MSVRFDASGDKLTRTANLPASLRGVTICGWFRIVTDTNTYTCAAHINSSGVGHYVLLETDSDGTTMKVWTLATSATLVNMTVNTWYFLAMTCSAAGVAKGYYGTTGGLTAATVGGDAV